MLTRTKKICILLLMFILSYTSGAFAMVIIGTSRSIVELAPSSGNREIIPNRRSMYSSGFYAVSKIDEGKEGLLGMFCVAKSNADPSALKAGLNWACGPGSANCSAIQPGQPCYVASNLVALASYAYNDYYQRSQATGGTCNFSDTATLTTTDPSNGSCIFAGSSRGGGSSGSGSNSTLTPPSGGFAPISAPPPPFDPGFGNGVSTLNVLKLTFIVPFSLLLLIAL